MFATLCMPCIYHLSCQLATDEILSRFWSCVFPSLFRCVSDQICSALIVRIHFDWSKRHHLRAQHCDHKAIQAPIVVRMDLTRRGTRLPLSFPGGYGLGCLRGAAYCHVNWSRNYLCRYVFPRIGPASCYRERTCSRAIRLPTIFCYGQSFGHSDYERRTEGSRNYRCGGLPSVLPYSRTN